MLGRAEVIKNVLLAPDIYDMELAVGRIDVRPGQFAMLYPSLGENLLPRPISIAQINPQQNSLRMIYQVVGEGTKFFASLKSGDLIKILGPLGNGFELQNKKVFGIVGGGIGTPPLLALAEEIKKNYPGSVINVYLGFKSNPILVDEFSAIATNVYVATDDGSFGTQGRVTDLIEPSHGNEIFYGCGPRPMLKALAVKSAVPCYVSMEERMACGLGACVGCAIKLKGHGYKKVCRSGPVFNASEVEWNA